MKSLLSKFLAILAVLILLFTAACSSAPSLPTGEYVFECKTPASQGNNLVLRSNP